MVLGKLVGECMASPAMYSVQVLDWISTYTYNVAMRAICANILLLTVMHLNSNPAGDRHGLHYTPLAVQYRKPALDSSQDTSGACIPPGW
jgi:hypothetical protein